MLPHLESKSFETRQAAAAALTHISRAVGIWDPALAVGGGESAPSVTAPAGLLALESLDVSRVLAHGTLLLGSSGNEYVSATHLSAEEIAQAHKDTLGRLGLGGVGSSTDELGLDMAAELASSSQPVRPKKRSLPPPHFKPTLAGSSSLLTSPNLVDSFSWSVNSKPGLTSEPAPESPPLPVVVLEEEEAPPPEEDATLSARERNRLKRRRKSEAKGGGPAPSPAPPAAKVRVIQEEAPATPTESLQVESDSLRVITVAGPSSSNLGATGDKVTIDPGAKTRALGGAIPVEDVTRLQALEVHPGEWPWKTAVERLAAGLLSYVRSLSSLE